MKNILIVAQYTSLPTESKLGRFNYIAEELKRTYQCNVEIVTTRFDHIKKELVEEKEIIEGSYKYTMLDELGYKKNIGLDRILSHYILSKNLQKYLKTRKKPDVIYCAIPSLAYASVAATYAKKNGIKFIIDIQDLWPEAFKMVFNFPLISNIIFAPMKWKANRIYRTADQIVAVSETYAKRAMNVNKKCSTPVCVFLGTNKKEFDSYKSTYKISDTKNEIWLAYIGTLGHSYDLSGVFDAMKLLKCKGVDNIKFLVMGDGPLKNQFQNYAQKLELSLDVLFTGRLDYPEMVRRLTKCDIAMNPIMHGAAQSIINKVGDYAMAGLPVISTQECIEYRTLLDKYGAGINCDNGDIQQLSDAILRLCNSKELRLELGKNNRRLAEERFTRENSYKVILDLIENKPK